MYSNVNTPEPQKVRFQSKMKSAVHPSGEKPDTASRTHETVQDLGATTGPVGDSSKGNAARVARHRRRLEAGGVKQVNLMIPISAHAPLKMLAKRLRDGEALEAAMFEVLSGLEQTGTARIPGFALKETETETGNEEIETILDLSEPEESESRDATERKRKFRFFR